MTRRTRIALITLGLFTAGTIAGGLAGALTFLAAAAIVGTLPPFSVMWVVLIPATIGGLLGGVLGPVAAWVFMRHVPLGLAVLGTTGGAVLGGLIGCAFGLAAGSPLWAIFGAMLGFFLAAVYLRDRYPGSGVRA